MNDGAERIFRLTERQARHRQVLEIRAQAFVFVLALISLLGGIALIGLGKGVEGLAALIVAITGLGGAFFFRSVLAQREEKALARNFGQERVRNS